MKDFQFIWRRLYSIPGIPWFERSCPSNHILLITTPSDPHTLFPPSTMVDPMACASLCWGCRWWHSSQVQEFTSIGGGNWHYCLWSPYLHLCIFSTVGEGHDSNRRKFVNNLWFCGSSKVSYPNHDKWLYHGIMAGLKWLFLTLLAVGADLLKDLLSPGPT